MARSVCNLPGRGGWSWVREEGFGRGVERIGRRVGGNRCLNRLGRESGSLRLKEIWRLELLKFERSRNFLAGDTAKAFLFFSGNWS